MFRKTVNHNGKTLSTDSNVKETYIGLQENIPLDEGINFIMSPTLVLPLVSLLEFPNVLKQ